MQINIDALSGARHDLYPADFVVLYFGDVVMHIGFLIFPKVQQLDLSGPFEVFASLPGTTVHLIWKDRTPIVSATGLILTPTISMRECPILDVICIPGGAGVNALLRDKAVVAFIRHHAQSVRFITSVCTGALVLGAAGLLRGKRATTHWNAMEFLPAFGAEPVAARVVRDGNLITGGGVTAGIDFALSVVAELAGRDAAEAIQLNLEYAPEPPFHSGHPDTAPKAVLAAERARSAAIREERAAIIASIDQN